MPHLSSKYLRHFSPVTEYKECYQAAPPPEGSNKDCRFDEFCACDFYELPVKRQVTKHNINVTFNHHKFNTTKIRAKKNHKTHCRVGEKGVCLHVCQLSILRPGSRKDATLNFFNFCLFHNQICNLSINLNS